MILLGVGARDCVTKYHKGEGGGQQKCQMIFFKNWTHFGIFVSLKRSFLRKLNGVSYKGGGGQKQCHQMTKRGRESKIGQKSVTYNLNGPQLQKR